MGELENFQMTNWRANTRQICHRYRKNSPLAISTDVGKSRYWNYLASKSAFLEIPRLNILQTCPIDREIKLTCAGQSHGTFAHRRDRCNLSDMQHPMSKKIGHSAILIVILTSLTLIFTGGLWRREPSHRIWESTWLLLRNLWRPRHWPPHPHYFLYLQKFSCFFPSEPPFQVGRSCTGARVAPAEKFGLGRKF